VYGMTDTQKELARDARKARKDAKFDESTAK
jgi:hypothetical protein